MDGGGAKGVIEATILDKIFVTVATTLKVPIYSIISFHRLADMKEKTVY
jgi:hypothetical protein